MYSRILYILILTLFSNAVSGQRCSVNIDSIINIEIKDHSVLHQLFRKCSRDSLVIDRFIKRSKEKHYDYGYSCGLNMMGAHCRKISLHNEAIYFHKKALKVARENDFVGVEIRSLNMIGVVYRRVDAYRKALDYHQEALVIAESIEPKTISAKKSIAVSLNSIGNIYSGLDQFDLALKYFYKAVKLQKELNENYGLAINYHNIGFAKEALGDVDAALVNYQKSLSYNTKINSSLGKVICNSSIGRVLIKKGENEKAIQQIYDVIEPAKKLRDKFHLVQVYTNLGWAYLNAGNTEQSNKYLSESLAISLDYQFKTSIEENYRYLALLSEKEGDFEQANFFNKKSRDIADELSKGSNLKYVNDVIIKYDTEKISNKLSLLEKEGEIDKLRYRKNRNILVTSCVVLVLLLVISYILHRQQFLKNEKKILTLKQDILRSQMNPHFVFNSLNSIKQYIITNDQKSAVYYLNRFAKLMRKILEASKAKEVSLADELETIKLYFSIENMRFSEDIKLQTSIGENVDLHRVKLPSLLLQPFIENSIWHGLSSKKGEKIINLDVVKKSEDFVSIKITDNGIGREKSTEIQKHRVAKKKSEGVNLTRDRLMNFVKSFKNTFVLQFIDLKDKKGQSKGTRVILDLPVR